MMNTKHNVKKKENVIKNLYSGIIIQVEKSLCKTMKSPWICQLKANASVSDYH